LRAAVGRALPGHRDRGRRVRRAGPAAGGLGRAVPEELRSRLDAMPDHPGPATVVDEVVGKYTDELVDLRRDLHAHPELSWVEKRTTDIVDRMLAAAGWSVRRRQGSEIGSAHVC